MCRFKFTVGSQIYLSFPLLVFLFLLSAYELLNWILIICPTGPSIDVTSSITLLLISAFSSPQPHPQKVVIKFFDLCSVMVGKQYLPVVLICTYPTLLRVRLRISVMLKNSLQYLSGKYSRPLLAFRLDFESFPYW